VPQFLGQDPEFIPKLIEAGDAVTTPTRLMPPIISSTAITRPVTAIGYR
jgi:hypothetical protein